MGDGCTSQGRATRIQRKTNVINDFQSFSALSSVCPSLSLSLSLSFWFFLWRAFSFFQKKPFYDVLLHWFNQPVVHFHGVRICYAQSSNGSIENQQIKSGLVWFQSSEIWMGFAGWIIRFGFLQDFLGVPPQTFTFKFVPDRKMLEKSLNKLRWKYHFRLIDSLSYLKFKGPKC